MGEWYVVSSTIRNVCVNIVLYWYYSILVYLSIYLRLIMLAALFLAWAEWLWTFLIIISIINWDIVSWLWQHVEGGVNTQYKVATLASMKPWSYSMFSEVLCECWHFLNMCTWTPHHFTILIMHTSLWLTSQFRAVISSLRVVWPLATMSEARQLPSFWAAEK